MRALAQLRRPIPLAEAEATLAEGWRLGWVRFNCWDPGKPWHGYTLSYRRGTDWRRPYVQLLQALVRAELRRAA